MPTLSERNPSFDASSAYPSLFSVAGQHRPFNATRPPHQHTLSPNHNGATGCDFETLYDELRDLRCDTDRVKHVANHLSKHHSGIACHQIAPLAHLQQFRPTKCLMIITCFPFISDFTQAKFEQILRASLAFEEDRETVRREVGLAARDVESSNDK